MDYKTKDQIVQQIVSGQHIIEFRNNSYLYKEPSKKILMRARYKYALFYKQIENEKIFFDEEQEKQTLYDLGIWSDELEQRLLTAQKNLEILVKERSSLSYRSKVLEKTNKLIDITEKEITKLVSRKNQLFNKTVRYQAEQNKQGWILHKCIFNLDNTRLWNKYEDYENESNLPLCDFLIKTVFYEGIYKEPVLREIARSEPWRTSWKTACKLSINLFDTNFLTDTQKQLCHWANLYDSVFESVDCPPSSIIKDDEELNNWLIKQNEEHENRAKEKYGVSADSIVSNSKIANAQEVFVKVDSHKDAEKVYNDLNGPQARNKLRQRQNALFKQGKIAEGRMPDTALDIQMRKNNLANKAIKQ